MANKAGLSYVPMASIDSALKRANTRIARLEDAFGRQSSTFKNQIARFEKAPLKKYTGVSSSGHWKLDKGKIMKDIASGRMNLDQANEILRNAAGIQLAPEYKVNKDGTKTLDGYTVKESNWGGFQTRKQLEQQTIQSITTTDIDLSEFEDEFGNIDITKETLKKITEKLNQISESFQTEYTETPLTEVQMKGNTILSRLYSTEHGGSRSKGEKLSYSELIKIQEELARVKSELDAGRERGLSNHQDLINS